MTGSENKQRFLVMHDYGMGGMWWWIHARSARQIQETFAEIEVVDEPETIQRAETWDLEEVDIDRAIPVGLDEFHAQRVRQRDQPGFGALADRDIVHLKRQDEDLDPSIYLFEVESDGRRLRQVELTPDGDALRSTPADWAFNPPVVDLFDPQAVGWEISRDEFEQAWSRARHDDRG